MSKVFLFPSRQSFPFLSNPPDFYCRALPTMHCMGCLFLPHLPNSLKFLHSNQSNQI